MRNRLSPSPFNPILSECNKKLMVNMSDNTIFFFICYHDDCGVKMLFCPRKVVKCYCWALFLGGPDIYKNVPNYYEKVTVDHFRVFQILERRASEVGNKRKYSGILNL